MLTKPRIAAACAALAVLTPSMAAPAAAGGFSFTLAPKGKDAKVIGTGLRLYSFAQGLKDSNKAKVDQKGIGNAAAASQSGKGNVVGIFQRGKDNSATASQSGNWNTLGIFQFGKNNATTAAQNGNGNVGLIFQGGW